jgi:glutamate 5-kinase
MTNRLSAARRIVVKIGSSTLVEAGALRRAWFESFAADVARMKRRGQEVLIVSSGAIAFGRGALGLAAGPLRLEQAQAAAAVGQIALARAWSEGLARHDVTVAQVLLTLSDTESRRRYLNARSTIKTLLGLGVVPVINENDTVATEEIRFGDNDRLAARVASMCDADCLVLLSDIDGLYSADPRRDAGARFIPEVAAITPEMEAAAGASGSDAGSGGMKTKLIAARIAMDAGVHMAIAHGGALSPLAAIENGARATWFVAPVSPATARKRWIAGALAPAGALSIDAGAANALLSGKSLLPAGVIGVEGAFERGDCVRVVNADGAEIARGLVAYDAGEARLIQGRRSSEIAAALGHEGRAEIIHRDDLVLVRT